MGIDFSSSCRAGLGARPPGGMSGSRLQCSVWLTAPQTCRHLGLGPVGFSGALPTDGDKDWPNGQIDTKIIDDCQRPVGWYVLVTNHLPGLE